MTNIIINGAKGRLGQVAVKAIQSADDLNIVAELGRNDDLLESIKTTQADIVLDLTCADAVYENTLKILQAGAHPVIGTSGLLPEQVESLQKSFKEKSLGGIIAPNFSVGALLMMKFSELAARHFQHAEILEMHHEKKKDAPSGTAIKTAQLIGDNADFQTGECKETVSGALGAKVNGVPIHSIRSSGFLAHQKVFFGKPGETLTIQHDTQDLSSCAEGILFSCRKASSLDELVFGLENLLL